MKALEVKNLTKKYPAFLLDGVSFAVGEGEIVGLIGRNGAGKSTTLKGMLNFISASGEVRVFGERFSVNEARAKAFIGYVGGGFRFYPLKPLYKIARTLACFYEDWSQEKYNRYFKQFGLDENKKVRELSEGMKVKFAIALALSRGARLLILDEPTSGLDPLSREELCDTLFSLAKDEGVSVLFSTHITSDLEKIADSVVYLSEGRVLENAPLADLLEKYRFARFASQTEISACGVPVYGVKRAKNGYEGLVLSKDAKRVKYAERTSIEQIMVHLEREGKRDVEAI